MARTKSFHSLVRQHVKGDAKFANALLREGIDATLSGDSETGKSILRDYRLGRPRASRRVASS